MKTKILALLTLATIMVAGCAPATPSDPNTVEEIDHTKGTAGASVTLIEYGDFQCPACGFIAPMISEANENFGDKVQFVYRHFPLTQIHPNALPAAYASEAAANQGKFWEMHDLLYERRTAWQGESDTETIFAGYAEGLGLDLEQFKTDMRSNEVKDRVRRDVAIATKLRLNSTPTIMINGQKIDNPRSYEQLKAILEGSIRDAKPAAAPTE